MDRKTLVFLFLSILILAYVAYMAMGSDTIPLDGVFVFNPIEL